MSERYKHLTSLPAMLRGGDYNPDQWLDRPDILEEDIRLMREAGVNTATLGVFSWTAYERADGEYDFTWLKERMDALYAAGICTELATPSGAKPTWLAKANPEIRRVQADGRRDKQGRRHNHCYSSPVYRRKVVQMIEHLCDAVGDHPGLIAWHLSNELGGACYCPLCAARFRTWLREKYHNDIEELNKAWWTGFWSHIYTDFEQIDPPFDNGEQSVNGLLLDWRRFTTWNAADYLDTEIEVLRRRTPNIPLTTNFMSYYPGFDYHVLAKKLDFVCWDAYPYWGDPKRSNADTAIETAFEHALIRGCKPGRPFLLMECTPSYVNWQAYNKLKRPGVNRLAGLQAVACGADGVQYFQWRAGRGGNEQFHGAVVWHDGRSDHRVFREVTALNEELSRLASVCGSASDAGAALLFDWDNRWALEDAWGFQRFDKKLRESAVRLYAGLNRHGVDVEVLNPEAGWETYPLVVLPMLYLTKPGFAQRLDAYVRGGGVVVATYMLGYVGPTTLTYLGGFPGEGLKDLFGVTAREIDSLYPQDHNAAIWGDGVSTPIVDYCELLEAADGTEVLARYADDFYAGTPAVTRRAVGRGAAYYIGARLDADGEQCVLRRALRDAGLPDDVLPDGVEYHCRRSGTERWHFYLNTAAESRRVRLPAGVDALTGKPVGGEEELPALGVAVVRSAL